MIKEKKIDFVRSIISEDCVLDGQLIINNESLNYFHPQYDLIFKGYNTHILSAKKQKGAMGANYYISMASDDIKKDQNYVGKVRTGSDSNTFNIFDNGERLTNKVSDYFGSKKR